MHDREREWVLVADGRRFAFPAAAGLPSPGGGAGVGSKRGRQDDESPPADGGAEGATAAALAAALSASPGAGGGGGEAGAAPAEPLSDEEVAQLVREREAARRDKNFAAADGLREQLRARGITVHDKVGLIR